MSILHLEYLSRDAYLSSISTIQDQKSLKFANMSLKWWDEHFNWQANGCVALCDSDNIHLCYIFFKMDQYRMYLTIHNIFTPHSMRRKGYAYELLNEIFNIAIKKKVKRFKLSSISKSLDFYLALGFAYWGVNSVGDYYCDLPIPTKGLSTLNAMVTQADTATLIGKNMDMIYKKVNGNSLILNEIQLKTYENDKIKMGDQYMLNHLIDNKHLI
ncbi:MAG: GNAT family N-acetyltransferase [Sulfurovum sp.]|nr:GNAT family N-acetyltransferase [Sulfurovum sp.]